MNIGVSRKEGITNKFSSGVVALVVIAGRPKNMQQLRPGIRILSGINHDLAADAQVWSELTGVENTYNEVDLNIYMIDFCTNWLRGEDFW